MGVDRIAPGIGGGDLGDGAIDGPDAAAVRRALADRILGDRADCLALPYLGIVGAAIDRPDNDIIAGGDFVGQPALAHAAAKWAPRARARTHHLYHILANTAIRGYGDGIVR